MNLHAYRVSGNVSPDVVGPTRQLKQAPLAPLGTGTRSTVRNLIAARHAARAAGAVAAVEALRKALVPWGGQLELTHWRGTQRTTYGGTSEKSGAGTRWGGSWVEHCAVATRYAPEVHPKGAGLIVSHGRSLYLGSLDAELEARTCLLADCDGDGDWRPIVALLEELGAAFLVVVRETAAGQRWHLTMPLAEPLRPPSPGDVRSTSAWKQAVYMPQSGWLLGWLGELGELGTSPALTGAAFDAHQGFDARADRLLQLEYMVCRRSTDDATPLVIARDGKALDWNAALAATGYAVEEAPSQSEQHPAARRSTKRAGAFALAEPPPVGDDDVDLVRALGATASLGWISGHLDTSARALGGTLGALGLEPARAGRVVAAAAWRAGCAEHVASMGAKASLAAARARAGERVPQSRYLRSHYPDLAAVVAELVELPDAVIGAGLGGADVPALVTAAEASERIRGTLVGAVTGPGGACTVVRSTPGAGKSLAMREALAVHVEAGGRAVVVVPTHELAEQTVRGLDVLGVRAAAPKGVARVRLPVLGAEGTAAVCLFPEAADLLARTGAEVRRTLCWKCPHKQAHPATGGECPAYKAGVGGDVARVRVYQQPVLGAVLAEHAVKLAAAVANDSSDDGEADAPVSVVVVDELPPLTTTVPLDQASEKYERARSRHFLNDKALELVEPLIRAVLRGVVGAAHGATWRELATRGAHGDLVHVERALVAARDLDVAQLWETRALVRLASFAVRQEDPATVLPTLTRAAELTELVHAVAEGAHHPDAPALRVDDDGAGYLVGRARWLRSAGAYLAAGGRLVLLDATAPVDALKRLLGAVTAVVVDAEDAHGVARTFAPWAHGARSRHVAGSGAAAVPMAPELVGALRRLATLAPAGARKIGVLAHKPVAAALIAALATAANPDAELPPFMPVELAALVAAGVTFDVGWYGNQRGLDRWADVDMLATLGDPWPHLLAARAEAAALGLEPEAWAGEACMGELVQAWGRARAVHRTTPVLIVHLGNVEPCLQAAAQWARAAAAPAAGGRPRAAVPVEAGDPATWPAKRERLGVSAREHARRLGVGWDVYGRRMREVAARGDTPPPVVRNPVQPDTPPPVVRNPVQPISGGSALSLSLIRLSHHEGGGIEGRPTPPSAEPPAPTHIRPEISAPGQDGPTAASAPRPLPPASGDDSGHAWGRLGALPPPASPGPRLSPPGDGAPGWPRPG